VTCPNTFLVSVYVCLTRYSTAEYKVQYTVVPDMDKGVCLQGSERVEVAWS
jgi:hypothetical protein